MPLPAGHALIKISPIHAAYVLFILMGVCGLEEEEPVLCKKMGVWYHLISAATDDQIDKMMKTNHKMLADLVLGAISCFQKDNLQEKLMLGMEQAEEAVANGEAQEAEYKLFCDYSKRILEMLTVVDDYSIGEGDNIRCAWTSKYTATAEARAIYIFVYSPVAAKS